MKRNGNTTKSAGSLVATDGLLKFGACIFFFKIHFKTASKSSFFRFGVESRLREVVFCVFLRSHIVFCNPE